MQNTHLFFLGHTSKSGDKACLSNWYKCSFKDENNQYCSTEQYMMYQKAVLFEDTVKASEILECSDPKTAKNLGRLVKNFNTDKWEDKACHIVYKGCLLKFSQNPELKKFLISTGKRMLVEASPYDKIWGIGLCETDAKIIPIEQWPGKNWLGKCLMKVRNKLCEDENPKNYN